MGAAPQTPAAGHPRLRLFACRPGSSPVPGSRPVARSLGPTRRLAAVDGPLAPVSAALVSQSALALPSPLLCLLRLAALSSPLPPHLAALFPALVDDPVASIWISVLKLCSGSCQMFSLRDYLGLFYS